MLATLNRGLAILKGGRETPWLAGLADRCMTEDRIDRVRETVKFLRKSAAELRQTATNEPDLARTLRHLADQCEAVAKEFAEHYGVD